MGRRVLLGLVLCLAVASTAAAAPEEGAALRVVQLLPGTDSVEVSWSPVVDTSTLSFGPLDFRQVSDFQPVQPGRYELMVRRAGETWMEATYGIGSQRHYTLVLYGIPSRESSRFETWWKKLTSWFAGSETGVPNGWVAQHRMLLEKPGRTLGQSRLRVMHAAPGFSDLSVKLVGPDDTVSYGTLAYPKVGGRQEIAPGSWTLVVSPPDSPLEILRHDLEATADGLTTVFLTGAAHPVRELVPVVVSSLPHQKQSHSSATAAPSSP